MTRLECLPTLKLQIEFSEKTTIWEEVMWVFLLVILASKLDILVFTLVFTCILFTN